MKLYQKIILAIVVILILARLALPYVLIRYVEKQINKIPDYHAKIADLDVHLWRGSYSIIDLQLWKISNKVPVPFFAADIIDLSLEWRTLLHGAFVAKVIVEKPLIHFVDDKNTSKQQLSIDQQWVNIVKSLFPLNINQLTAYDGEIYFENLHGDPPFKTYMKNTQLTIENMQKVENSKDLLSSNFHFSADPMGGGEFLANGKYNPFDKKPTFYIKAELTNLNIHYIADLLKHYTMVDVVGGRFSLYGEAAAADGKIKGYAKPFIKNLKIGDPKKESPLGVIYNGAASVVAKILENSDKKTIATDIKLQGNIDDPNASVLSIIGYLLRHAFIQSLIPQVDNTIKIKDVIYGKSK